MKLDAASGEAAQVVEGSRQIAGEPIEMVDDDRPGGGRPNPLRQAFEAFSPAAADAVVADDFHELPAALDTVATTTRPRG